MLTHIHKCWKLVGVNTFAQGTKKKSFGEVQGVHRTEVAHASDAGALCPMANPSSACRDRVHRMLSTVCIGHVSDVFSELSVLAK